jgi:hypothetical protein
VNILVNYKTDIVEPICPFKNGLISFGYIGTDIVEPIYPLKNGYIGYEFIGTNILEPKLWVYRFS